MRKLTKQPGEMIATGVWPVITNRAPLSGRGGWSAMSSLASRGSSLSGAVPAGSAWLAAGSDAAAWPSACASGSGAAAWPSACASAANCVSSSTMARTVRAFTQIPDRGAVRLSRDSRLRSHQPGYFGALDRVDAEIGFEVEVGLDQVGRVPGSFADQRDQGILKVRAGYALRTGVPIGRPGDRRRPAPPPRARRTGWPSAKGAACQWFLLRDEPADGLPAEERQHDIALRGNHFPAGTQVLSQHAVATGRGGG